VTNIKSICNEILADDESTTINLQTISDVSATFFASTNTQYRREEDPQEKGRVVPTVTRHQAVARADVKWHGISRMLAYSTNFEWNILLR
jgi:hypothetical protein